MFVSLIGQAILSILRPEYRIWASDRDELTYREGNHRVRIWISYGTGNVKGDAWVDGSATVRWDAPHDDELIPEEKRTLILERVMADIKRKDRCTSWTTRTPEKEEAERLKAAKAREVKRHS